MRTWGAVVAAFMMGIGFGAGGNVVAASARKPKVEQRRSNSEASIEFQNDSVTFFARGGSLNGYGTLFDFRMNTQPGPKLQSFTLQLNERSIFQRAVPGASMHLPVTRYTIYSDLDGDSQFDTMMAAVPDEYHSYIMLDHRWTEVQGAPRSFLNPIVRLKDGSRLYTFKNGAWETVGRTRPWVEPQ